MQRAARRISDIGPSTVTGLLNDLIADDASDQIIDQLARGGGELMRQILARAAARGEAQEQARASTAEKLDGQAFRPVPPGRAGRDGSGRRLG